jgi:hypothetical protein
MILKENNRLTFSGDLEIIKEIPVGNWLLMFDEKRSEYILEKQDDFILPNKIYGEEEKVAERYLNTFKNKDGNLGILLTGIKGNGKSLMAKLVCNLSNLPVIIITQSFNGESFQNFLSSIKQEIVVFVDEFEKVYKDDKDGNSTQEELLPILDGVFQSKKLFLFTTNTLEINQFLKNRPGRIYYLRKYFGLDKKVIEEVIQDKLKDKTQKSELMNLLDLLGSVSMDVLDKLIQEMNLYNEPATTAIKYLNIQIEHNEFDVLMYIKGKRHVSKIYYNPITSNYVYVSYKENDEKSGDSRWRYYEAEKEDLTMEVVNSEFVFKDREGNKLIFTPSKTEEFQL